MEGGGASKDLLAAVNERLKNSLQENIQQHSLRKQTKEEQKRYMQECEAKGLPFAKSLCLLFGGLKPELDADKIRESLDGLRMEGFKHIRVQSVQLVSEAEDKNRRNQGREAKHKEPVGLTRQEKEYSGKAFVVFGELDNVLSLKQWALRAQQSKKTTAGTGEYCLPLPHLAADTYVWFSERQLGHRMYHEDAQGLKVKAVKLQVGNKIGKDFFSIWFETGAIDNPIELEVSRMHRQLKLRFEYGGEKQQRTKYCLSVKFSGLVGSMLPFKDSNQRGKDCLCLMFTLKHPPHIFKKAQPGISVLQDDVVKNPQPKFSHDFKWSYPVESQDDGWERTVDFTKDLNAFGSVFTYRLVLMDDDQHVRTQDVLEELSRFRLLESLPGQPPMPQKMFLKLERLRYSPLAAQGLVDQYTAALNKFQNNFEVSWRLHILLHKGRVFHEQLLNEQVVQLLLDHLERGGSAKVIAALEDLLSSSSPVPDFYKALEEHPTLQLEGSPAPSASKPSYCVQVPRLVVTPTRACCSLGNCELSNRVLRKYKSVADRFLRVTFSDEAGDKLQLGEDASKELKARIYQYLRGGIHIGNRHYKFLAFSNSQIYDNSCWMFAEVDTSAADGLKRPKRYTCDKIRRWLGDFSDEKVVAKYAACMGQCFSSSIRACQIGNALEEIPDIKAEVYYTDKGKPMVYIFSDGVGRISLEVAYEITRHLRDLKLYSGTLQPCAFQIQCRGCKGMLVVWGDIEGPNGMVGLGRTIQVRPSMRKFESQYADLEVVGWSRWMPGHLNQQIILLLEDRGVGASTFVILQAEYMQKLMGMMQSREAALSFLVDWGWDERSSCLSVVKDLLMSGFTVREPFVNICLEALRGYVMKELRTTARIQVRQSAMLYGIMDELGILEQGEVYVCIQKPGAVDPQVIVDEVIVTKNPCLHPGDVRKLKARDVPEFRRLNFTNVVVFPQKGKRPHPSEAAGSDLDGDIYFCCWEQRIVQKVRQHAPFHYQAPKAITRPKVEIKDVVRFFFEMMSNDALGGVAQAWMACADKEPLGPSSEKCLQLAAKHHQAVNFPKTGVLVDLAWDEIPYEYPHFMANKTKMSYTSTKVLGQLYDNANLSNIPSSCVPFPSTHLDEKLVLSHTDAELWLQCWRAAENLKLEYENELIKLMNRFDVFSEAEMVCGLMVEYVKHKKRRWASDVRDQVLQQVQALWVHFHRKFEEMTSHRTLTASIEMHRLVMASACYCCTYAPSNTSGARLLSFPWVVHYELCKLKMSEDPRA